MGSYGSTLVLGGFYFLKTTKTYAYLMKKFTNVDLNIEIPLTQRFYHLGVILSFKNKGKGSRPQPFPK